MDGWIADGTLGFQLLSRLPLSFAPYTDSCHKRRTRHGDTKALLVAVGVAATSGGGFRK